MNSIRGGQFIRSNEKFGIALHSGETLNAYFRSACIHIGIDNGFLLQSCGIQHKDNKLYKVYSPLDARGSLHVSIF